MQASKTRAMLIAALILAGLAGWMAYLWVQKRANLLGGAAEAGQVATKTVLVAATAVQYGQVLQAVNVKTAQWPSDLLPEGAISDIAAIEGTVAKQDLYPNDLITQNKIAAYTGGSVLAALVSPNKRAMSVRVNDVVGVSGFLRPGNHVDVLNIKRDTNKTKADTVLENIKVLAIDQDVNQDDNKPKVVRSVTLEVTKSQAEDLALAMHDGSIQLVLRNPLDDKIAQKAEPAPAPKPVAVKKPTPKVYTPAPPKKIQVIRGTEVEEVKPNT